MSRYDNDDISARRPSRRDVDGVNILRYIRVFLLVLYSLFTIGATGRDIAINYIGGTSSRGGKSSRHTVTRWNDDGKHVSEDNTGEPEEETPPE